MCLLGVFVLVYGRNHLMKVALGWIQGTLLLSGVALCLSDVADWRSITLCAHWLGFIFVE